MSENAVLIACSMLGPELEKAMRESHAQLPVVWMPKGLHERPENLRRALQCQIDLHQDKDAILLCYCLCGTAAIGLHSERTFLYLLKFDDCIRMLMSNTEGKPPEVEPDCLYCTKEWIDSDKFIVNDMQRLIQEFGDSSAAYIMDEMVKGYKGLNLIDDGAYEIKDYTAKTETAAQRLNLAHKIVDGTTRPLTKLLTCRKDPEICAISPGETVSEAHFNDRPL